MRFASENQSDSSNIWNELQNGDTFGIQPEHAGGYISHSRGRHNLLDRTADVTEVTVCQRRMYLKHQGCLTEYACHR